MSSNNILFPVLDLATVRDGCTPADSFSNSVALAQHAEQLGYTRYWFAEHHNMPGVASSAPALLIGHIAGKTSSIRVGSGGVMLPNHAPLVVAEQFGTLASLYPGRIDLGLGRAPGTDQLTASAIRGKNFYAEHDFPGDIRTLQTLFSSANSNSKVRAIPGEGLDIPIWILGSSTDSAVLAAAMGLPYAFASHFAPAQFLTAIKIYRERFVPSDDLQEPYVMACVNVVAADTDEEAQHLSTSVLQLFKGTITGKRGLLRPPVKDMGADWTPELEAAVRQMLTYAMVGGPATMAGKLRSFIELTGVNEIMATSHIYDPRARIRSYQIFAEAMQQITTDK